MRVRLRGLNANISVLSQPHRSKPVEAERLAARYKEPLKIILIN